MKGKNFRTLIRRVGALLRIFSGLRAGLTALAIGAALLTLAALLGRFGIRVPGISDPLELAKYLCPAFFTGGFLFGVLRRIGDRNAAIYCDRVAGTKDIFAAALECGDGPFSAAVKNRADRAAGDAGLQKFIPRQTPGRYAYATGALLTLFLTSYLPVFGGTDGGEQPRIVKSPTVRQMTQSAEKLEQAAKKSADPELAKIADEMKKLAEAMRKNDIDRKQAFAKIRRLRDELEKRRQAEKDGMDLKRLIRPENLRDLEKSLVEGKNPDLAEALKKLSRAMKLAAAEQKSEELKALAETAEKLAQLDGADERARRDIMAALERQIEEAERNPSNMTAERKRALDEARTALQEMKKEMRKTGQCPSQRELARQLAKCMQGMGAGEGDALRKNDEGAAAAAAREAIGAAADSLKLTKEDIQNLARAAQTLGFSDGQPMDRQTLDQLEQELSGRAIPEGGDEWGDGEGEGAGGDRRGTGADWGVGSTNEKNEDPAQEPDGHSRRVSEKTGESGVGEWQAQYDGERTEVSGRTQQIRGVKGAGKSFKLETSPYVPREKENLRTKFSKDMPAYRIEAEDALSGQKIPREYEESVKRYYDSLRD